MSEAYSSLYPRARELKLSGNDLLYWKITPSKLQLASYSKKYAGALFFDKIFETLKMSISEKSTPFSTVKIISLESC